MRDDREGRRDYAHSQAPAEPLVHLADPAAQIFSLGQNALGMFEHQFALPCQADELVSALDNWRAKVLLELTDCRRQRRLRDVAGLRRSTEMFFARERDEIFQLPQHHPGIVAPFARARLSRANGQSRLPNPSRSAKDDDDRKRRCPHPDL